MENAAFLFHSTRVIIRDASETNESASAINPHNREAHWMSLNNVQFPFEFLSDKFKALEALGILNSQQNTLRYRYQ